MMAGTPKWEIQLIQLVDRALAQSAAVMDEKGLALATVMRVATGGQGRANKLSCLWVKWGCGTRMVAGWSWTSCGHCLTLSGRTGTAWPLE